MHIYCDFGVRYIFQISYVVNVNFLKTGIKMKREIDIVVISDVHLGTYGCHATELVNYLKSIKTNTLVLNGDFIEIPSVQKKYFPESHMEVVQCILQMASEGTKVYYIVGNHDDGLRKYANFSSGNIHLRDKLVLKLKGKTIGIFHGDIFDASIKYSKWVTKFGERGHRLLINLNRLINNVRSTLNLPKMSFSKKIKQSINKSVNYLNDFEQAAIDLAEKQGYDYVICGHIHQPQMKVEQVRNKKITYLNSGDWVENLTALEYKWGRWSIFDYAESTYDELSTLMKKTKNDQDDDGVNANVDIFPTEFLSFFKNKSTLRV